VALEKFVFYTPRRIALVDIAVVVRMEALGCVVAAWEVGVALIVPPIGLGL
jgi:hypothetical protein